MSHDHEITVRGERLTLMIERTAYWAARETLFVADPHFGKAAAFRAGGIPVPRGTTSETITRLDRAVQRMKPARIVWLGDFLHAKPGRSAGMFAALIEWRARNATIELLLVRGNHDRHAGDPPAELGIECVNAPHFLEPFVLAHYPGPSERGYTLAGHVHPGVRLYGPGGQRERLPCFFVGKNYAVLPAFGEFTGLADIDVGSGGEYYAIAENEIVRIPTSPEA